MDLHWISAKMRKNRKATIGEAIEGAESYVVLRKVSPILRFFKIGNNGSLLSSGVIVSFFFFLSSFQDQPERR